jgi:glycosyltransferase involved in cell wall biosynthesis
MNILLLHGSSDLYGASKIFLQTAEMLQKNGHSCHVVLSGEGPLTNKLQDAGIPFSIINLGVIRKKYYNFSGILNRLKMLSNASKKLQQLVKTQHTDLIYSNTTAVWIGAWVARKMKVKHLWHVHEIIQKPVLLKKFIGYLLNKWADKSVVVSDAVLHHWQPMVSTGKLVRVYNGIDFQPAPEGAREKFRRKYEIPQNAKVVGMAGRVHYWKGQMQFLQIAKYLNRSRKYIHFVIAGDPYPGYEYLVDEMNNYIRENELEEHVHYIGYCDDMPAFYSAIDSFMLPSTGPDPFPTVILEAMHAGKPVVCTITGGAREMVEKNQTGTYISMENMDQAAALTLPSLDPRIAALYSRNAIDRVQEYFTKEAYEKNMLDVIQTI